MRKTFWVTRCVIAALALLTCSSCASARQDQVQPRSSALTLLANGPPARAGLSASVLGDIDILMNEGIRKGAFPGAVVCIVRHGVIAKLQSYGYAALYRDDTGDKLSSPSKMNTDTLFDLASLSKLFTAVAALKLVEQGRLKLDEPVVKYIPAFGQNGKDHVSVRMLLTHTSGLEPGIPLWKDYQTVPQRLAAIYREKLIHAPGTVYVYSDLNFIMLGVLIEKLTGQSLQAFVEHEITEPLGLTNTMYNPPENLKGRIAATEYQPWTNRGLLWGQVEDENAWALGGVAGHAGIFSTARDLAVLAQMILNGGSYGGHQILKASTLDMMAKVQSVDGHQQGLGFELNQGWYMGLLSSEETLGHTGFSGTSIVIDKKHDLICILLTNRVHPSRNGPSINLYRAGVANDSAKAMA